MAKSVVGLLIGIALKEGAIRSIDDLAETYVAGLKDTEYGRTPIKALLLMASGVAFSEDYANRSSDISTLARLTIGPDSIGSIAAVKQFNTRRAAPGARFSYSSAESLVLGLVLAAATKRTVSDYAAEKLWQPLGAEADATWIIDKIRAGGHVCLYQCRAPRLGTSRSDAGQSRQLAGQDDRSRGLAHGVGRQCASDRNLPPGEVRLSNLVFQQTPGDFRCEAFVDNIVLVDPDLKLVLVQTAVSG